MTRPHALASSGRRDVVAALGIAAVTALAWQATAQEAREPLKLQYQRDGACPDADAFFAALQARTQRVRAARPGERARTLAVRVGEAGRESVGTLSIIGEDGATSTSTRTVGAASCDDVVDALSLIAALAVDPSASVAPAPSASTVGPPASSSAPSPPTAAPVASLAAAPSARAPVAPSATPARSSTARPATSPPEASPAVYRPLIGASGEIASTFGGRAAVGAWLGVDVERPRGWSPRVMLHVTRTLGGDVKQNGTTGALTLTAATLGVCPLRVAWTSTLAALPCVSVTAGSLAAEGKELSSPASATRAWLDVGLGARLVWRPATWWSVEPSVALRAPLTRDRFYVEPDVTVYQAPRIAVAAGIDGALHFF